MSNTKFNTTFTDKQLEELNRVFPEDVSLTTTDIMMYRNGQRSVIKHMEMLVAQAKNRGKVL